MQLQHPFYRLPLNFDHARLKRELDSISESEWMPHPSGFKGNAALILASVGGSDNNETVGTIELTPRTTKLPYIKQVLASFNTVIGRARLMRLDPGEKVKLHTDINYYWRHRMRIHVPITTADGVDFYCDEQKAHLSPGQAWALDTWRPHEVHNNSDITRIHLVFDTVGSPYLWDLLETKSWNPPSSQSNIPSWFNPMEIPYIEGLKPNIIMEKFNVDAILPPSEVANMAEQFIKDLRRDQLTLEDQHVIEKSLIDLSRQWRSLHAELGVKKQAKPRYLAAVNACIKKVNSVQKSVCFKSNNSNLTTTLNIQIGLGLVTTDADLESNKINDDGNQVFFDRPVIILAAPRSGSTLLYETLANNKSLWSINGESHRHIEDIDQLNALNRHKISNVLSQEDADDRTCTQIKNSLQSDLITADKLYMSDMNESDKPSSVRFLEKTPKNSLRIPFLNKLFPDAIYVYLQRNPESNISSIMEGWKSGRYVTYKNLPNWGGEHAWSYLLPDNWEAVKGKTLSEIAYFQYESANKSIMKDLQSFPKDKVYVLDYDDFINNTKHHLKLICQKAELPFGERMQQVSNKPLPLSRFTLDAPKKEKWRKNEKEMEGILDSAKILHDEMNQFKNEWMSNR
jgi:hypothetical protein